MSPRSHIPKGFRRRIRSDCRELAIVRVLLQANTPLTAGAPEMTSTPNEKLTTLEYLLPKATKAESGCILTPLTVRQSYSPKEV